MLNLQPSDPAAEIDFALELVDRLGSAHLPWTVTPGRTVQRITNAGGVLVAECFDSSGIVPELIVRAVNALPAVAAELAAVRGEQG